MVMPKLPLLDETLASLRHISMTMVPKQCRIPMFLVPIDSKLHKEINNGIIWVKFFNIALFHSFCGISRSCFNGLCQEDYRYVQKPRQIWYQSIETFTGNSNLSSPGQTFEIAHSCSFFHISKPVFINLQEH